MLFGRLRGMRRKDAQLRADALIEQFDMAHAADRRVGTYSVGMRRRIDIAAALVVPPKVLFLDEPTTGLDPRSRRDVWDLVSSLSAQGVTVLLTTQYLEEADVLSDSIVVIDHGRVIASGTAEELKSRVGFSYCTVSPVNPADLSKIFDVVADLDGAQADHEANTVSVLAPDGVATLTEVFRRVDQLGVELPTFRCASHLWTRSSCTSREVSRRDRSSRADRTHGAGHAARRSAVRDSGARRQLRRLQPRTAQCDRHRWDRATRSTSSRSSSSR